MASKTVSAERGSTLSTIRNLWPYMWPEDRPDLRARVVWATVFLFVAKLTLVAELLVMAVVLIVLGLAVGLYGQRIFNAMFARPVRTSM